MKKHLMTGLIILMPVVFTLMIIFFLFDFFTAPFVDLVQSLLFFIEKKASISVSEGTGLFISRLFALLFLVLFIFVLGIVARWFLIKNFLSLANRILSKIPLVKTIYKVSVDLISAIFATDGKKVFKAPVIVPFSHKPSYAVGFKTGDILEEIETKTGKKLTPVFAPTAPHPISGFLFFVPNENVHEVQMTNEETIKFLVSCGMVYPTTIEKNLEDL